MFTPMTGIQVDKFYPPTDWQYNTMPLTVVGHPNIINGVIMTPYDNSNFIRLLSTDFTPSTYSSWEFVIKIKTGNALTDPVKYFFGNKNDEKSIIVGTTTGDYLKLFISTNSGSSFNLTLTTTATVSINTSYYVRFGFSGSKYYLDFSTDGINYVGRKEVSSTDKVSDYNLDFGSVYQTSNFWNGEIDINNSCVKINGAKYQFQLPNQTFAPIDIRKNAENNSIVLLVGHSADFTKYSLLGLLAQVSSGTYDVYIDDVLVGSGVTSNTQYDIDFSTIATTYGTATTPEALVLHKVVVKPNTSGATITRIRCARTIGVSTQQNQGVLWCHFELENNINLANLFNDGSSFYNRIVKAITSKGDVILTSNIGSFCRGSSDIRFVPLFKSNDTIYVYNAFGQAGFYYIKRLRLKTANDLTGGTDYFLNAATNLEQICFNKKMRIEINTVTALYKLKMFPKIYNLNTTNPRLTEANKLYPTKLNFDDVVNMTRCQIYGTSTYPMRGLRGLKVSNEAPFSGSSPQIDVSYTGLDRDALVELFNSLPAFMPLTAVGSPTISSGVVSGFSASDYFSMQQIKNTDIDEIVWKVNIPSSALGQSRYMNVLYGVINFVTYSNSSSFTYSVISTSGLGDLSIGTLQPDTNYWLKYVNDGNMCSAWLSEDGITFTKKAEKSSSLITQSSPINYVGGGTSRYFSGSIDINNSYMVINGTKYTFLLPSATTRTLKCVGATGNNLTVVGSPTIDENGVASGFSNSDYLQNNNTISQDVTNFVIRFKFSLASSQGTSTNGELFYFGGVSTLYIARLIWSETYRNPVLYLYDWTTQTLKSFALGDALDRDTNYILEVFFNNGTGTYNIYNESGTLLKSVAISGDFNLKTTNKIVIGKTDDVGNIYLENTYIKVGHNYLIKGYLTDTDKNIALNKGWQLTLS